MYIHSASDQRVMFPTMCISSGIKAEHHLGVTTTLGFRFENLERSGGIADCISGPEQSRLSFLKPRRTLSYDDLTLVTPRVSEAKVLIICDEVIHDLTFAPGT